jgi:hypothetical protein
MFINFTNNDHRCWKSEGDNVVIIDDETIYVMLKNMIIYGRLHKMSKRGIKDNNNNNTQVYTSKTILRIDINTK